MAQEVIVQAYNANLRDLECHRAALEASIDALFERELLLGARARRARRAAGGSARAVRAGAAQGAGPPGCRPTPCCPPHPPPTATATAGEELEAIMAAHPPAEPAVVPQITPHSLASLAPRF